MSFSKMIVFSAMALVSLLCLVQSGRADEPDCASTPDPETPSYIRKADCKGYYMCFRGNAIEMQPCTGDLVFSMKGLTCVRSGSELGDCVVPETNDPVNDDCIKPHPIECQAFFNCSLPEVSWPSAFEDHMDECPYPQLFNDVTNQCDDFENVDCGNRKEAKSPCQYRANRCPVSHCIPCWARYPGGSCIGKEDGVNAHENKLWTPNYVTCYKERTISAGMCGSDENKLTGPLFHPSLNGCVSTYLIPVSHNGNMPVCNGLDGALPDEFGRCNRYTICEKGVYISSKQCDDGLNFDPETKTCRSAESFCGVCGNC